MIDDDDDDHHHHADHSIFKNEERVLPYLCNWKALEITIPFRLMQDKCFIIQYKRVCNQQIIKVLVSPHICSYSAYHTSLK